MICKQCECHILRERSIRQGKTVNCLAYGCDHFNQTGTYCHRDDIVRYVFDLFKDRFVKDE